MADDTVLALLSEINGIASNAWKDQRQSLLTTTRSLVAALEAEDFDDQQQSKGEDNALTDKAWMFCMSPVGHAAAISAWQCGLLVKPWPRPVMTATELAAWLSPKQTVDPLLIGRLLRVLQLYGVFEEIAEDTFRHTPLSTRLSLTQDGSAAIGKTCHRLAMGVRGINGLPAYLTTFGYINPGDTPSLFQWSNRTELDLFRHMAGESGGSQLAAFHKTMVTAFEASRSAAGGRTALDQFPLQAMAEAAITRANTINSPAFTIVDVGGGYGHVLTALRASLPSDLASRGRFVLEDLAESLGNVPESVADKRSGIELQPYDFLAETQPIVGADVYIFRHILHDWFDTACRTILQSTVQVMSLASSKILLVEEVMPAVGASAWTTLIDVNLMSYGGMNRTLRQWEALVAFAGLRGGQGVASCGQ
ncbi:hypothetical protein SEUCBS139899_005320 [Sporothrix eucalyptigena]